MGILSLFEPKAAGLLRHLLAAFACPFALSVAPALKLNAGSCLLRRNAR